MIGRVALLVLFVALTGCGDSAPPGPPQSEPVGLPTSAPQAPEAPQRVVVPENPGVVQDVVPVAELTGRYPALGTLSKIQRELAVGALHLVPGPCGPCIEAQEHLARCAMRAPTQRCANIGKLVQRAVATAAANKPLKIIMEEVHYPDTWVDLSAASAGRVAVDLIVAESDPWLGEAMSAKAALQERYGSRIEVRVSGPDSATAQALEVRATPAWAVAGYRMRGAQSAPALGRLIDRETREYK